MINCIFSTYQVYLYLNQIKNKRMNNNIFPIEILSKEHLYYDLCIEYLTGSKKFNRAKQFDIFALSNSFHTLVTFIVPKLFDWTKFPSVLL